MDFIGDFSATLPSRDLASRGFVPSSSIFFLVDSFAVPSSSCGFLELLSVALTLTFLFSMDDFRTSRAMPRSPPPKGSFLKFGLPFLAAVVIGSFVLQYFTQTRYDQQQARNVRVSSLSVFSFVLLLSFTILWTTDNPRRRREGVGQEEATQHSGRILCKFLFLSLLFVSVPYDVHLLQFDKRLESKAKELESWEQVRVPRPGEDQKKTKA